MRSFFSRPAAKADHRRDQSSLVENSRAPFAAARIEQIKIDIEHIVPAVRALQDRVEHVVVEGAGGWLVPLARLTSRPQPMPTFCKR